MPEGNKDGSPWFCFRNHTRPSQGPKDSDAQSSLTDRGDCARRFVISGVSSRGTSEAGGGSDPTQAAFSRRCPTHLSWLRALPAPGALTVSFLPLGWGLGSADDLS